MTSVKSQLYVTFGINGHRCADCLKTDHNESEACTSEPFSKSLNEKRSSATELVTAAKINSEQPCGMSKALRASERSGRNIKVKFQILEEERLEENR